LFLRSKTRGSQVATAERVRDVHRDPALQRRQA
jgi:hypothetical protein